MVQSGLNCVKSSDCWMQSQQRHIVGAAIATSQQDLHRRYTHGLSHPLKIRIPSARRMSPEIPSRLSQDPLEDPLLRDVPSVDGFRVLDRRYVILEVLGQGGMGVVYYGKHVGLENEVAIKCLDPALLRHDEGFAKRFLKEARAAARIEHENVVRVYDVAEARGLHFLVMEFIEGEDVRRRVNRKGPLAPDEACRIALATAMGLAAIHAAGLVHRDIKPDNILIGTDGRVKVADLGLAKQLVGGGNLTNTGMAMGTPRYMPPEQFSDTKGVGPSADVYSLGATLYLMLTGKDGVANGSFMEVADHVRTQAFPDPRVLCPSVPAELAEVVLACTQKNPCDRPQDGGAVIKLLKRSSWNERTTLSDPEAGSNKTASMVSPPPADLIAKIRNSIVGVEGITNGAKESERAADMQRGEANHESRNLKLWAASLVGLLLLAVSWTWLPPFLLGLDVAKAGVDVKDSAPGGITANFNGGMEHKAQASTVNVMGKIELETPPDSDGHLYFTSTQLILRGHVENGSGQIELSEAGTAHFHFLQADGSFAIPIQLQLNEVRKVKLGIAGGDSSLELILIHDAEAPLLELVDKTQELQRTNKRTESLTVRAMDSNLETVEVQGRPMSAKGEGLWSSSVFLQQGTQEVLVKAVDRAGRESELVIPFELDQKAPMVLWRSIQEESVLVPSQEWHVRFEFDELPASVTLDEVPLEHESGYRFSGIMDVTRELGAWNPVLEFCDELGNCGKERLRVEVQLNPRPTIQLDIQLDKDGTWFVPDRRVFLSGRALDFLGLVELRQDGNVTSYSIGTNGEFAIPVLLGAGERKEVELGLEGTNFSRAVTLVQDELPPQLVLIEPRNNPHRTNTLEQEVVVEVIEANLDSVTIDEQEMEPMGGNRWRHRFSLQKGEQSLLIKAKDRAGGIDLLDLDLVLDQHAPKLFRSSLEMGQAVQAGEELELWFEFDEPLAKGSLRGNSFQVHQDSSLEAVSTNRISATVTFPEHEGPATLTLEICDLARNCVLVDFHVMVESAAVVTPVDSWADVIVHDPDPVVVTDVHGRARMRATGLPWKVRDRGTGIVMLLVPPGDDVIGASQGDGEAIKDEKPSHRVRFGQPFYLGETEVTQAEWKRVMVGDQPSYFSGPHLPVEQISWYRINEGGKGFLAKTGMRLPSECEWEYACRAGTNGARYGSLDGVAWFKDNAAARTQAVGMKAPNPWGFKDMLGNVWEWCSTVQNGNLYLQAKAREPIASDFYYEVNGDRIAARGGCWDELSVEVRASKRGGGPPDGFSKCLGFRVARNP